MRLAEFSVRRELSRDRAMKLLDGTYHPHPAEIGGVFGLDLEWARCALCGGRFPPVGECRFWWEDETLVYAHIWCASIDLGNWAEGDAA